MAKDIIHEAVLHALQKDGWSIVADPYPLQYAEFSLRVDLAAERISATEGITRRVIVEVKSFVGLSFIHQFQQAIGQYSMYRDALELNGLDYEIYLAVSAEAYQDNFQQMAVQHSIEKHDLKLVVVDIDEEQVLLWIN
ncbi:MAG: hypothetical protein KDE53_31875 [Caldilineaceae bacterium]|nr:hypothetical protein [Caldilineaceae bacterium]